MRLNPPIPPEPELPPAPVIPEEIPLPEPKAQASTAPVAAVKKKPEPPKLTMKIKAKKKVNKVRVIFFHSDQKSNLFYTYALI